VKRGEIRLKGVEFFHFSWRVREEARMRPTIFYQTTIGAGGYMKPKEGDKKKEKKDE